MSGVKKEETYDLWVPKGFSVFSKTNGDVSGGYMLLEMSLPGLAQYLALTSQDVQKSSVLTAIVRHFLKLGTIKPDSRALGLFKRLIKDERREAHSSKTTQPSASGQPLGGPTKATSPVSASSSSSATKAAGKKASDGSPPQSDYEDEEDSSGNESDEKASEAGDKGELLDQKKGMELSSAQNKIFKLMKQNIKDLTELGGKKWLKAQIDFTNTMIIDIAAGSAGGPITEQQLRKYGEANMIKDLRLADEKNMLSAISMLAGRFMSEESVKQRAMTFPWLRYRMSVSSTAALAKRSMDDLGKACPFTDEERGLVNEALLEPWSTEKAGKVAECTNMVAFIHAWVTVRGIVINKWYQGEKAVGLVTANKYNSYKDLISSHGKKALDGYLPKEKDSEAQLRTKISALYSGGEAPAPEAEEKEAK